MSFMIVNNEPNTRLKCALHTLTMMVYVAKRFVWFVVV